MSLKMIPNLKGGEVMAKSRGESKGESRRAKDKVRVKVKVKVNPSGLLWR